MARGSRNSFIVPLLSVPSAAAVGAVLGPVLKPDSALVSAIAYNTAAKALRTDAIGVRVTNTD